MPIGRLLRLMYTVGLLLTITGCVWTPNPTPTPAAPPTASVTPTATAMATAIPTATPTVPPTITPTPTERPPPTATPPISIEPCPDCTDEPEIEGVRLRSTFSEAVLNELLAPYLANAIGVRNVYLDVVPGGLVIRSGVYVLGQWISVSAHNLLDVQDGTLLIYLLNASVGPFDAPGAAVDVINSTVIPSVNTMIYDTIQDHNPYGVVYLTGVESTNTDLTVEYIVRPPDFSNSE